MNTPAQQPKTEPTLGEGARTLLTVAAVVVIVFGLRAAREVAVPIVMAVFLATVSYPVTHVLRRMHFPHWLSVGLTVLADLGIIFGIYRIICFLAADMANTLQGNLIGRLQSKFNDIMGMLDRWGVGDHARALLESPQQLIDPQQLIALSRTITGQVVAAMSITVLVLILMTFILGEAPLFRRNLTALPNSMEGKAQVLSAIRGIQRYLLIKTIASVCTGLLAWGLCHIMGIPFALLWGFVACVLNYIPTIGSIVAAVPPILLALLLGEWSTVFLVSGGYLAINFSIGNCIEPLFLGKQFGIATTVVLLSVIIWGWVWGPFGMLLAVPFTVLTKLALENSRDLNWVTTIISDNPSSDKHN